MENLNIGNKLHFYNNIECDVDITRDIRNNFKNNWNLRISLIKYWSKGFVYHFNVGLVFSSIVKHKWC